MNIRQPLVALALPGLMALGLAACHSNDPGFPPDIIDDPPDSPPDSPYYTDTDSPPPVSGGTLLVTTSDLAVAADVDHDTVWIVDLRDDSLRGSIPFDPGVEPGRLVEDASGRVHMVLRRAGRVATLDVDNLSISYQRPVCPAPRGLAYDAQTDLLHVACVGGELVTLPASDGPVLRSVQLEQDLRDVVIDGDMRMVSRFTSAQVLVVDSDGQVVQRIDPPAFEADSQTTFKSGVAWRAQTYQKTGGMALLHQRALDGPVDPEEGYHGGGCSPGLVHSTITVVKSDGRSFQSAPIATLLGVDMAINSTGDLGMVANAGSFRFGSEYNRDHWVTFFDPRIQLRDEDHDLPDGPCFTDPFGNMHTLPGPSVAVAFDNQSRALVQTREPDALSIFYNGAMYRSIEFPTESAHNMGHTLFHASSNAFISCASCHPEGREDGLTWNFRNVGPRRTQSLRGGLMGTEPFHWSGDMADMTMLMDEVFGQRMFHTAPHELEVDSLSAWLEGLPTIPKSRTSTDAVTRGKALFEDPIVGCASCHNGPLYTDNRTVDVGTGEALQVPRLEGVWARPPFMHDGCAATLEDRFGPCGGGDRHGQTSHLSEAQISDLVAYLKSL